jgi:hypothetical protein
LVVLEESGMKRQLTQVISELDHAQARLDALAENISNNCWSKRKDPQSWSPAECVAHLNLTSEAFVPRIRKAIEEARQLPRAQGEYKRDLLGKMFGGMVGPMPKIAGFRIGRVKTPAPFVPSGELPKNIILAEFKRLQMLLSGMAGESDELALDKVKVVSPFGEKIRYNCYSALVMIPRHQERHLEQAELAATE